MACIVGKAFAAFFVAVCISMVTSFGVPFPSRIMLAHSMRNKCLKMRTDGIDLSTQIFCNVELNADYIEAVGFDLDFTLAQVKLLS